MKVTANVKPHGDWVVYKRELLTLPSGIVLADSAKASSGIHKFIVKAKGPKVKSVNVGEEIVILPRQIIQLKPEAGFGEDLYLIREEDIMGGVKRV